MKISLKCNVKKYLFFAKTPRFCEILGIQIKHCVTSAYVIYGSYLIKECPQLNLSIYLTAISL